MSQRPDFGREKSAFLQVGKAVAIQSYLLHLNTTKKKKPLTLLSMVTRWLRSTSHSYRRFVKI